MTRITSKEITGLSLDEKLNLVEELWDSIAAQSDNVSIPNWQIQVLDERLSAMSADDQSSASWPDVKNKLLKNE